VLSVSAESVLWPRYGAPEVAKNEKYSFPHYHQIVFFDTSSFPTAPSAHTRQASNLTFIKGHFLIKQFVYELEVDRTRSCLQPIFNPIFRQFLRYSWQKSGYIDGYIAGSEAEFDTP
jgi:hypothetical protein